MSPVARPQNSTNVRTKDPYAPARWVLRTTGAVAPPLAAAIAERLFLTAPRHVRPAWEREVLASAETGSVTMPTGEALPTCTWGDGPTVLLVHGWSGRGSQLGAFVPSLVASGHRVVTFDGPGHGDARAKLASVVTQARAVNAVMRSLGRVHAVIAHSVGGASSVLAASWSPEDVAERYVLVAPPRGPARFVDGFARALALSPDVRRQMIARVEQRYGIAIEALDASQVGATFARPALVLHDQDDREVPIVDGKSVAAAIRAELVVTTGLGHRRILRDAAVIERAMRFVSGNGSRPAVAPGSLEAELYLRDGRSTL